MAKIISIVNLKGGVGKSTIAMNLACALAAQGHEAVVVDADSQGTSSFWGEQGSLPVALQSMPLEDRSAARRWTTRLLKSETAEASTRSNNWQYCLRQTQADYVIVDCPPHVGLATRAAVEVADIVLIPVTASAADVAATAPAIDLVMAARRERSDGGPKSLLVPSRIDRSTTTGHRIESILKQFGHDVGPAICQRIAFADSIAFGQWIGDYAPNSPGHKEVTRLADRVKRMLQKR
jgi:chromosome partitioning protein